MVNAVLVWYVYSGCCVALAYNEVVHPMSTVLHSLLSIRSAWFVWCGPYVCLFMLLCLVGGTMLEDAAIVYGLGVPLVWLIVRGSVCVA